MVLYTYGYFTLHLRLPYSTLTATLDYLTNRVLARQNNVSDDT